MRAVHMYMLHAVDLIKLFTLLLRRQTRFKSRASGRSFRSRWTRSCAAEEEEEALREGDRITMQRILKLWANSALQSSVVFLG